MLCFLFHKDVASGRSGHAEVVLVEYDSSIVNYEELLEVFWKSHDPTQASDDPQNCPHPLMRALASPVNRLLSA